MVPVPEDRKYTPTHEWARAHGNLIEVGITEFAQHQLSDITYVELPEPGRRVRAGEETAVVESIKAASDIYAPVAGTVAEVNPALADAPETINSDPYGAGWLFRLTPEAPGVLDALQSAGDYAASLPAE